MIGAILRDLRYAARTLRRSPAFTLVAVLTFAVGIGMNVLVFSVIDRLLFRPLPYAAPQELVLLRVCDDQGQCFGSFPAAVANDARRLSSFDRFATVGFSGSYSITPDAGAEPPIRLISASPELLRVLGVSPVRGRDWSDDDAASNRSVALLSHETWQSRFGGSESVLGSDVWSRTGPTTIVGVLPAGFIPPMWNGHDAQWDGLFLGRTPGAPRPVSATSPPIARLKPGVTIDEARTEVAIFVKALEPSLRVGGRPVPQIHVDLLQRSLFDRFRSNFRLILGTTGLLLLLACANLATLLLAYGRSREREAAIAGSLGASRWRLVREALAASMVICLAGAVAALAAVAAGSRVLAAVLPPVIARYATEVTDARVLLAALLAAVICALAGGIVPAFRAARVDLLGVLQRSPQSARPYRLRGGAGLLTFETAIGVVLVLSGLLMMGSFNRLAGDNLGFDPDGLHTVSILTARASPAAALASYQQMLDALAEVPGVAAVGGADSGVGSGSLAARSFSENPDIPGGRFEVSTGYFQTIGATLLAGRPFTDAEVRQHSSVAIVSRAAARTLWPDAPVGAVPGRVLRLGDETPVTIVGVVPDFKNQYGQETVLPALFVPLGANPSAYPAALIRVAPGARVDLATVRQRVIERIGPATVGLTPVSTRLDAGLQDPEFRAVLFTALALASLLLCASGLYAVAAFDVRQRRYELGVRLSVGATARDIQRMVVARTCAPVVAGLFLGFIATYWSTRLLQQFLYQIEPRDPAMYVSVAAILLATGLLAAWIPAWRAGRIDPVLVLRSH